MSDINYFEIIQNKLDALVEKIIQKENSDENFRITYAQILEKINTKMDVFSSNEDYERISLIAIELRNLMKDRQEVVDGKFNAIKGEFDNLNEVLTNSLKTPELLAAFNKIENQIHYFAEEQENQKFAFNSIISHIEKFGTLEETNDNMRANFAIVKEQNTIINENVNKQIELVNKLNEEVKDNSKKALSDLNTIIFSLKEFSESINDDAKEIKEFVNEKVDAVINKIHETDSFVEVLNNNLTTLIQVVGNIFEDEDFIEMKSDIADILVKTALLSEAVKKFATKDELLENSSANKEDIKKYNKELIENLEKSLLEKLDFSDLEHIKDFTEKMFFQGTEVLKEEIWSIKDTLSSVQEQSLTSEKFLKETSELKEKLQTLSDEINAALKEDTTSVTNIIEENAQNAELKFDEIKNDITDFISEESVAASSQINALSSTIENLKKDISEIVLNEQNEQITEALQNLQSKFVTQMVQIADNISFTEDTEEINDNILACTDELKEKITSDVSDIEDMLKKIDTTVSVDLNKDIQTLISGFKVLTNGTNENKDYVYTLPDIESDLSKIRLDINNIQKTLFSGDEETKHNDITTKLNNIREKIEKIENSPLNSEIAEVKYLFGNLSEDISSISKRTNKLILTSDEVNKTLKNNINAFTGLLAEFEKQSNEFYNSAFINELDVKVDNITRITNSVLKSDQVMNEAFMYLAEWIDSTSESFNEIKDDVGKIKRNLLSDEETETEKLARSIKTLSQKVEEQAASLESVDDKLNRILAQQNDTKELKSLIEYVASQVSVTNEKIIENDKLAQRIASMEKQLKKIEKNISVITEYLEDEEDEEFIEEDDE
ncbi:MAG: hypothetical protein KHX03_00520 [Clostridium sp.]|nr:hypothetical protein [Clostridium sp.]